MKRVMGLVILLVLMLTTLAWHAAEVGNSGVPQQAVAISFDKGYLLANVIPAMPMLSARVEAKDKQPLPPGGLYVVLRAYLPNIPDLSKQMVQPDAQQPARQMKPSEWLKAQKLPDIEWVPTDRPTFVYFPKDWVSTLNDKEHLTKGLKVAASASMTYKTPDGKETKMEGVLLYQVEAVFSDEADLANAYPHPSHQVDVMLVNASTGTFGVVEKNGFGEFTTSIGPLEEGWTPQNQEQAVKLVTDVLETLGCFVATAVYHTPDAPQLVVLRAFRDKVLMTSQAGAKLVAYYYQHGPYWAREVSQHPLLQVFLKPVLSATAMVLKQINLDSPTTQKIFHGVIDVVEWIVSPLVDHQPHHPPATPVGV